MIFETGKDPAVTVPGKPNTKNRKLMKIPVRRALADLLQQHLRGKLPTTSAFDMPAKWETADMIRSDLEAARAAWIAEGTIPEDRAKRAKSDFLAAVDSEGRRVDFHALRTTCGTWLEHAGVAPSIAKRVTGHASEQTLRRHYHRATLDQPRRAVEALPAVDLRATGTDDPRQQSRQLAHETVQRGATPCDDRRPYGNQGVGRNCLPSTDLCDDERLNTAICESEGDGARTRNLRIDSPVL